MKYQYFEAARDGKLKTVMDARTYKERMIPQFEQQHMTLKDKAITPKNLMEVEELLQGLADEVPVPNKVVEILSVLETSASRTRKACDKAYKAATAHLPSPFKRKASPYSIKNL